MLTAIVLFWVAVQLQAPTWVYFILSLKLVLEIVNAFLDIALKLTERSKKKAEERFEEQMEMLKRRDEEQK